MKNDSITVAVLPRNDHSELRLGLERTRRGIMVEVRVFEDLPGPAKVRTPTKGLSLPAAQLPDLLSALTKAQLLLREGAVGWGEEPSAESGQAGDA